jgi:hypothetical protein
LGVLAPTFLAWAHIRSFVSSGDLVNTADIQQHLSESEWTDLHTSEISAGLTNLQSLLGLLETGAWDFRWGETFLVDPLIALVPRAIWPDRPDALQIVFTHAVDPSYPEGGTLSFSFVLEGYLNFGIVGAAAWGALIARGLVALRKGAEAAAREGRLFACLVIVVLQAQAWFYIRDDFGDLVRRSLIMVGMTAAAAAGVRAVGRREARAVVRPGAASARRAPSGLTT